jgi:hypothetical protein
MRAKLNDKIGLRRMIMTIIIKAIMSGLTAATVLAVVGTSASAAFSPKDLGVHQTPVSQQAQQIDKAQVVKALWSDRDQQKFWDQEEDRGG